MKGKLWQRISEENARGRKIIFLRRGAVAAVVTVLSVVGIAAVIFYLVKFRPTQKLMWIPLAMIAGGLNALYQIERLPLMAAISVHGGVLYLSCLATYLVNDWLEWGPAPILVFSGIFIL